jgi:hypothetical protein
MSPDEDEKRLTERSPCAVKAARTVTTGGMGKHSLAVRPVPTQSTDFSHHLSKMFYNMAVQIH